MIKRKLTLTFCLLALFASGVTWGLTTTSSTVKAAPVAKLQSIGDCTQAVTYNRTCPESASYCPGGVGSCSWLISLTNSIPNCAASAYGGDLSVKVEVLGECDDDIYDYQFAFYSGGHFVGGGSSTGGTEYFCLDGPLTSLSNVYVTWRGMPPSSMTKGPSSIRITVCCTECEE